MSWKIIITESIHPLAIEKLAQSAGVTVLSHLYGAPDVTEARMAKELQDADLVILRGARITGNAIRSASRLKAIIVHGAGVDSIDTRVAAERGLPIITTPSANAESVAEFTLALIFCLAKNLIPSDREMRASKFLEAKNRFGPSNMELWGKTLGLIGWGQVGRRVCRKAGALGLKVLAYSRHATREEIEEAGGRRVENLEELLKGSDIVSIHCALTEETRHLIGEPELHLMKPSSFLINTARGAIVDEKALISCLKERRIAGAGIDVYEAEPPSVDNELFRLDHVVLAPHVAGISKESSLRLGMSCAEEALRIMGTSL